MAGNDEKRGACFRCYVSGRVQGVFFRVSMRDVAIQLSVSGYTRNLSDGRVEVYACGKVSDLQRLKDWLWEGPPEALVTAVECEQCAFEERDGFRIA